MGDDGRVLRWATVLYAVGFTIHTADHLRRGVDTVTDEVFWLGNGAAVVAVAAIVIVALGHRLAPLVAVAAGFPLAFGYAVVHLVPDWGEFSDAFPGGDVDLLSWVAVFAEIGGALALGGAGLHVLRRRGQLVGRSAA